MSTRYLVEGQEKGPVLDTSHEDRGWGLHWGWEYVAGSRADATHETEAAAEAAADRLAETTGWDRARIRVREVGS